MTGAPVRPAAPRRLTVLHLGFEDHRRPGSGGGSVRNVEVNRRLAAAHDITVLTTDFPGATDRTEDGVRYVHIGLPLGYVPSLLSYFAVLPFVLRRYPADLVVEEFAAPFSSVLVPLWTGRPTLALVQWLNGRQKSRQYRLPFAVVERAGVRVHRRFVAVSDDLRAQLLRMHPGAHVDVVANGVEPLAFAVSAPRGQDVVFLGRLEQAQKGVDLLLAAYAGVADRLPGRLVVAGDGPDRARLAEQAATLGLGDRVHFAGRVVGADKYALLAGARLVAVPSRYETFGMVALEALATGTPVVAFEIPCLREVVPQQCGRLVARFDVEAFGEQLVRLHGDLPLVERLGAAGRQFAAAYDWEHTARGQEQAYLAAVDAPRPGRRRLLATALRRVRPSSAAGPGPTTRERRSPDLPGFTLQDGAGARPELVGLPDGPQVFLSPHLDDAVLSCGALMAALAAHRPVTVVTVFTAAAPPPHTLSARTFLRQCGEIDAEQLYAARRAEDAAVLARIGVAHVHLGAVEALFRQRTARGPRRPAELRAAYPTYRLHVLGRVAAADDALLAALTVRLRALLAALPGATLYAPLGVGGHVDHRFVRLLAQAQDGDVVHYADQPYALASCPEPPGPDRVAAVWTRDLERKAALVAGYATQAPALFPGGRVPELPEHYLLPADRVTVRTGSPGGPR